MAVSVFLVSENN